MRVLLVNPPSQDRLRYSNPPIGLLYLASSLRMALHEVDVADGCLIGEQGLVDRVRTYKPDIVGMRVLSISRHVAIRLAALIKAIDPRIKIVMGGPHASVIPEHLKSYPFIDAVCVGDGERWIVDYVGGVEPQRNVQGGLDRIPFPAWELVNFDAYKIRPKSSHGRRVMFTGSRGCTQKCSFCFNPNLWRHWRARSPENMLEEITLLHQKYGIRDIFFTDDTFSADRQRVLEFCLRIVNSKMRFDWTCITRVDLVDREMLELMSKAGCREIRYGLESGSPKILSLIHKDTEDIDDYLRSAQVALAETRRAGIRCVASMMVGNYGETDETIGESVAFLAQLGPSDVIHWEGVMLLPGTALYRRAVREGYISDEFWYGQTPFITYPHPCGSLRRWGLMLDRGKPLRVMTKRAEYFVSDHAPDIYHAASKLRRMMEKVL